MNSSACPAGGFDRRRKKIWRAGWSVGMVVWWAAIGGCQAAPPRPNQSPPRPSLSRTDFRPDNIYVQPAKLPASLQRVAILPLAAETAGSDLPEGCVALTPVLWEQLVKAKKFEVVAVDAAKLRSRTGQVNWTGGENLPPDFFAYLRREYGCEAVLFTELTTYRAYAPLAIGWRLKLVDARTGQILWAADELFDAAHPGVSRAAQRFGQPKPFLPFFQQENWVAVNSPRRFGSYSAAALLDTLPER
jgi:hypothetical protein